MRNVASNPGRWSSLVILASALAWSACSSGVAPAGDGGHDGGPPVDGSSHGDSGGGGGDMMVAPDTGPGTDGGATCGNGVVETGEQCDDMNTNNDDSCKNDCTLQCGDGMVNAAASETCDTAIATGAGACPTTCDDGMVCTTDSFMGTECTTACVHTALAAGPMDGCCPAGASSSTDPDCAAGCGNGVVDSGETCDTGITSGAGACPTTCDDGIACTTDATTGSACTAGCTHTAITTPSGTTVDGCCPTGATHTTDTDCPVSCGNGVVDSGETCDTGIATGAGSCPMMASCDDSMACTTDALVSGGTCMAACSHTPLGPSGATLDGCCPSGANMTTDHDCTAVCGNSVVETGETCDPPMAGTCDATCHTITGTLPTAYRVSALRLIAPRVTVSVIGCADITDGTTIGLSMSLNQSLMNTVSMDGNGDGFYDLSVTDVFRPLDRAMATNPMDIVLNAQCSTATPSVCMVPPTMPMVVASTANHMMSTACYTPVAADVNAHCAAGAGSCTGAYSPTANTVSGPCYVTNEADIMVTFTVSGSTLTVPLHHARMAGQWVGAATPPTRAMPAIIVGFLGVHEAADVLLPASLPLVGGQPLYRHLQTGGASTTNTAGATVAGGCNVGGGRTEDDRDTLADGSQGFWFFLNATLDLSTWSGP